LIGLEDLVGVHDLVVRAKQENLLPSVSVILPVFNGARFLHESISSILNQNRVSLELIIINDASTDDSEDVIRSFRDSRIHSFLLPTNLGLAATLNFGIQMSQAHLIARQDQDDISAADRIEKQLAFLHEHSDVALVGTWATIVKEAEDGTWQEVGMHRHPTRDPELRMRLLWNNPFVHSSVMFRRQSFEKVGQYNVDPVSGWPEDYDLWSRMMHVGKLGNISQPLVTYRTTPGGLSDTHSARIRAGVVRISEKNLATFLAPTVARNQLAGLSRALNGISQPRVSVIATVKRIHTFHRAVNKVTASKWSLPRQRLRWTLKLLIRSSTSRKYRFIA
jgi:hypothetical protein